MRTPLSPQWVKPIGTRRKMHKYGVLLLRLVNLPVQIRNRSDKLLVLGLYNVKFAKVNGGVCRMICGVGPEGEVYDEECLRAELEVLRNGVEMEIPDDTHGGKETVIVEFHLLGWLADLLGAHGLGPWPESFSSARHCCRDCWWHSGCWCAHIPPGSRDARSKRPHAEGCRHGEPRLLAELQQDMSLVRSFSGAKTRKKQLATEKGIAGADHCVLEHLAGSNMETDACADLAHILLLGVTRSEIFLILDDLIPSCLSWDELNEARKAMNLSLPKGHRIPHLERPTTDGKRKSAVNMNLTAAEVMHFTVNR